MQLSVLSAECGCPKSGACVCRNFANAPAKKLDGDDVRRSEDEKPLQVLSYRMTVKQLFVAEEHLGVSFSTRMGSGPPCASIITSSRKQPLANYGKGHFKHYQKVESWNSVRPCGPRSPTRRACR